MRLPTTVVARAGLARCAVPRRAAVSHAAPLACMLKLQLPASPARASFANRHTSRVFLTTMTPPPPPPSTPSQSPPSSTYSSAPDSPASAASSIPNPTRSGLPYTRRTADNISETVADPISASEEGAACPTILSQVEHTYTLPHPLWKPEQVVRVHPVHRTTESTLDTLAYFAIRVIRFNFDTLSGWKWGIPTTEKVLTRCIFLESIAGVPGSVAGFLRHLASLRRMRRDYGWIHTLQEEAENERMHLLTFLKMKQPGPVFRGMVWLSQGIFTNFFFLAYVVSPRFCHRLVGYLEEEAVKTYTETLKRQQRDNRIGSMIDGGFLEEWKTAPAPDIAVQYWKMSPNATIRDVVLVIRADEDHHREVNHCLADLDSEKLNPYKAGE